MVDAQHADNPTHERSTIDCPTAAAYPENAGGSMSFPEHLAAVGSVTVAVMLDKVEGALERSDCGVIERG